MVYNSPMTSLSGCICSIDVSHGASDILRCGLYGRTTRVSLEEFEGRLHVTVTCRLGPGCFLTQLTLDLPCLLPSDRCRKSSENVTCVCHFE